jgi:hypothetical protein
VRGRRVAAIACVAAIALASVFVPAMHAEVHAREAEADAPKSARQVVVDGVVYRFVDHVSDEIETTPHAHGRGAVHHHHHHDGDRPGHHGADAPEHFAFAIAPASPPILPPPYLAHHAAEMIAPPAPVVGPLGLDAHRNRGPPANA